MVTTLIPESRLAELEGRIDVRFGDRSLLGIALVHASYLNENPETDAQSNERIEFLGDAVVDLAVGHALLDRAATATEGQLTAVRALVVRSETLARAAARLGLGEYLLLGKGERSHGGTERVSNLADAFEAVVGAIFLDQGYEAARKFVLRSLNRELTHALAVASPKDPKSLLQEVAQAAGWGAPSYRVVCSEGPDHMRRFTIEVVVRGQVAGTGEGARKVDAEREAASRALEALADTTRII
ncbi:MAG: ribonuclease III [Chloroflexi bacterium]|nr:ribonuclease III [Chloroflexota bacterium]